MLFNSAIFLIFGALFYLGWPLARERDHTRWLFLVVASFIFYGWWDWRFLFLIMASGMLDYVVGLGMVRFPGYKKHLLVCSIAGNLGSLAAFKYLAFLSENLNRLLELCGSGYTVPLAQLALPVGISFYTFQSMSYTIDVFRGQLQPTRNVLHFFAYLAMFPQLVAGPIIRASALLPQLKHSRSATPAQRWDGVCLIAHGYFKKVVIADNLAPTINAAFGDANLNSSCIFWWVIMTMFALQIYCDFSGYSDIARGLAKWMGYDFELNFNHPYIATGFRDFWARWHISLSSWFRDYVYIPLGGAKEGAARAHANMWLTMLLSGLWHGAAWTFVMWGALHALYLFIERVSGWPRRLNRLFAGRFLVSVLLLAQVWVAWVFFRAESWSQSMRILTAMFDFGSFEWAALREIGEVPLFFMLVAMLRELYFYLGLERSGLIRHPAHAYLQPVVLSGIIVACVYFRGPGSAFIYFQF